MIPKFSHGGRGPLQPVGARGLALIGQILLFLGLAGTAFGQPHALNLDFFGSSKSGLAATGLSTNDTWCTVGAVTNEVDFYTYYSGSPTVPIETIGTVTNLSWMDGSTASGVWVEVTNLTQSATTSYSDDMLSGYLWEDSLLVYDYNEDTFEDIYIYSNPSFAIHGLPDGLYELLVYGVGDYEGDDQGFRVRVGDGSFSNWKWTYVDEFGGGGWVEDENFVKFSSLAVTNGEPVLVEMSENFNEMHLINGLQILDPSTTNATQQLPDVAFSPGDGTPVPVDVTLSVPNHGDADVYFTLDGSQPSTNSTQYSSAISLTSATTIKAFATKPNSSYDDSDVSQATYPLPQLPSVEFSPASGALVPTNVTLSVPNHGDAEIHFTLDGSTPTGGSPVYTNEISLTEATTIKAFAEKSGYISSAYSSASYDEPVAPTPAISPASGGFNNAVDVTISSTLSGATLLYSLDDGSTWNTYSGSFEVDGSTDIQAKTTKTGYEDSLVATNNYTFTVALTDVDPDGGVFTNAVDVTFTNTTTGAVLEYIWDGGSLTSYSGPINLSESGDLEAIASKAGYTSSTNTVSFYFDSEPPSSSEVLVSFNLGSGTKTGQSAYGISTNDTWNTIGPSSGTTVTNIQWWDGTDSPLTLSITNLPSSGSNGNSDAMVGSYAGGMSFDEGTGDPILGSVTINDLRSGNYDFYLYGIPSSPEEESAQFRVDVDGQATSWKWVNYSGSWYDVANDPLQEDRQYVVFTNINVTAGATITIETSGGGENLFFNGLQIANPYTTNAPPSVDVGQDLTVTLPASGALSATVEDDGLPAGETLTYAWSKISGPGNVVFADAGTNVTTATFSQVGSYVLRLTADDSDLLGSDDLTVTVNPDPNQAPVVDAGNDQTLVYTNSVSLAGSATDDGLPAGGGLTYSWSQTFGTGTASFNDASAASTTVSLTAPGIYVLRLTADDSAKSAYDELVITAQEDGTPSAAPSISITAPSDGANFNALDTINISASASDTDGSIASVAFFVDGGFLGSDTSSPYGIAWEDVPAGSYTLTAVATDSSGTSSTSSEVDVLVQAEFFITDLGVGVAADINDAGQVVGNNLDSQQGFVWLPTYPNAASGSFVTLTNNMLGAYTNYHLFTETNTIYDLYGSGSTRSEALAISEGGLVAGSMLTVAGETNVFEPQTELLFHVSLWTNIAALPPSIDVADSNWWSGISWENLAVTTNAAGDPVIESLEEMWAASKNWYPANDESLAFWRTNLYADRGESFASGINDNQQISGTVYSDLDGLRWAFTKDLTNGQITLLPNYVTNSPSYNPSEGVYFSAAHALNGFGQTVGVASGFDTNSASGDYLSDFARFERATLWQPGSANAVSLGTLVAESDGSSSQFSAALGLNAEGIVVGVSSASNGYERAFIWTPAETNGASGQMNDLEVLSGFTSSAAYGVNNNSVVVGSSWNEPSTGFSEGNYLGTKAWQSHSSGSAFVYDSSNGMRDLGGLIDPSSEWQALNDAKAVNEFGQIVGLGYKTNASGELELHGFVLTPTVANPAISVSLTAPSDGAVVVTPNDVQLQANASSTNGTISQVEFYHGSALIGVDYEAPYAMTWTSPAPGNYVLTARAIDEFGTAVSSPVDLTVKLPDPAPIPSISPAGGIVYGPTTITISNSLAGATHYYSTNGVQWYEYTGGFLLDGGDVRVFAKSVKEDYRDSGIGTSDYDFKIPVTSISPDGGSYTNAVEVTFSNALSSASLIYSLDNGATWQDYTGTFPLDGIGNGTGFIRVWGTKMGYDSDVSDTELFDFKVAAPTFSHASGSYTNVFDLSLDCATTNAVIDYSFDGVKWNVYSAPVEISNPTSVHARTRKPGYETGGEAQYIAAVGFTSVQGVNNWLYRYASTNMGAPDSLLPLFDAEIATWRLTETIFNMVGPAYQHPGDGSDSVRTFVAPHAGEITILSRLLSDTPLPGADGVQLRILKNSTTLEDWMSLTNSQSEVVLNTQTSVASGDEIHFQLNAISNVVADLTRWNPVIRYDHSRAYDFTDTDGDGLSDIMEAQLGTNSGLTDTDGDGVDDYLEWLQGRNPLAGAILDTNGAVLNLKVLTPLE